MFGSGSARAHRDAGASRERAARQVPVPDPALHGDITRGDDGRSAVLEAAGSRARLANSGRFVELRRGAGETSHCRTDCSSSWTTRGRGPPSRTRCPGRCRSSNTPSRGRPSSKTIGAPSKRPSAIGTQPGQCRTRYRSAAFPPIPPRPRRRRLRPSRRRRRRPRPPVQRALTEPIRRGADAERSRGHPIRARRGSRWPRSSQPARVADERRVRALARDATPAVPLARERSREAHRGRRLGARAGRNEVRRAEFGRAERGRLRGRRQGWRGACRGRLAPGAHERRGVCLYWRAVCGAARVGASVQ